MYAYMSTYVTFWRMTFTAEQAKTWYDEITHINNSLGSRVVQGLSSPRCCSEPWHRGLGGSGPVSPPRPYSGRRCQSARGAPGGWGLLSLHDTKDMTSVGGLTHRALRGEIMRKIWRSYATSSSPRRLELRFIIYIVLYSRLWLLSTMWDWWEILHTRLLHKTQSEFMLDALKGHRDLRNEVKLIKSQQAVPYLLIIDCA